MEFLLLLPLNILGHLQVVVLCGLVRVVSIKTPKGVYKRPVTKLAPCVSEIEVIVIYA